MRKIAIFACCCVASLAAMAQTNVVKDAERVLKASPEKYPDQIKALTPAFTNPETAGGAYVWYVAGKGGMDYYDKLYGLKAIGRQVDDKSIGHALIDSYGYLLNALPLDSVVDAKGKIKTKYSKDIIKLVQAHHNDLNLSAINLWGVQDYDGAYASWDLYTSLPDNAILGKNAPKAPADSTMSDIYYNMGLAAWQADKLENALSAFDKAIAKGYDKKNIFDYAISVAYNLQNTAKMAEYAAMAYPLYGNEDTRYIGFMINDKIANKQYDEAQRMLERYIEQDPNNAQLYYVLGILFDSQEIADKATENYKKAIEIDPNNAQALLQYGRQIYNKAIRLDDSYSSLSTPEYNEKRNNEIDPIFKDASIYLEKAYELDPENMHDAITLLRSIYYNINDAENLKRIESL